MGFVECADLENVINWITEQLCCGGAMCCTLATLSAHIAISFWTSKRNHWASSVSVTRLFGRLTKRTRILRTCRVSDDWAIWSFWATLVKLNSIGEGDELTQVIANSYRQYCGRDGFFTTAERGVCFVHSF